MGDVSRTNKGKEPPLVAAACWFDLLGYGRMMEEASFDPNRPTAKKALHRLRTFHGVVSKHSSTAFPTLVINDGAVAYSGIGPTENNKSWLFIQRCWELYTEASNEDKKAGGCGLRAVISVGLRAKGSNRGIKAQQLETDEIIDQLAKGEISAEAAKRKARNIRRSFDVIPALQANFAFTRAYLAEQAGRGAGLPGPNIYFDVRLLRSGVPSWMSAGEPVAWTPRFISLATTFIAIKGLRSVGNGSEKEDLLNGRELLELLRSP